MHQSWRIFNRTFIFFYGSIHRPLSSGKRRSRDEWREFVHCIDWDECLPYLRVVVVQKRKTLQLPQDFEWASNDSNWQISYRTFSRRCAFVSLFVYLSFSPKLCRVDEKMRSWDMALPSLWGKPSLEYPRHFFANNHCVDIQLHLSNKVQQN